MLLSVKEITVGARSSNLSKAQVQEVQEEIRHFFPEIVFHPLYLKTFGDKDQKTSLRSLDKTDFFTREIDQMLLKGECRIAIHSAKDLPEPLAKGLTLAALTKGIDPSDSLVLREGVGKGATIATSSLRREVSVQKLIPDAQFVDIRGTIEERLQKLLNKEVDGVVVAEAALIRLKLTCLNRIRLPGVAAPLQGRLAIVVRERDQEMLEIFKELHEPDSSELSTPCVLLTNF